MPYDPESTNDATSSRETQVQFLWEDDDICVIHKPPRLLVHPRTAGGSRREPTLLQRLREQLQQEVYCVHRLDRATSGIMVCAKSSSAAAELCRQFRDGAVSKTYRALVRGFITAPGVIDRPLNKRSASGRRLAATVAAVTRVTPRVWYELPLPCGRYETVRCTEVSLQPETGRWHQLRRHLNHFAHPVIGDVEHGDNTQNRLFREQLGLQRLLLAATRLHFSHPISGQKMRMSCEPDHEFQNILMRLQDFRIREDAVSATQSRA